MQQCCKCLSLEHAGLKNGPSFRDGDVTSVLVDVWTCRPATNFICCPKISWNVVNICFQTSSLVWNRSLSHEKPGDVKAVMWTRKCPVEPNPRFPVGGGVSSSYRNCASIPYSLKKGVIEIIFTLQGSYGYKMRVQAPCTATIWAPEQGP